ncbi:membrane protein [Staphylococcus virus vB_SurM-PSU5]|nr:membrane protein [Staphylococcus virus vB_SurM-PSU5]
MPMNFLTIASVAFIAVVVIDLVNDDMSYVLTSIAILLNVWAGFYGWFYLLQAGLLLFLLLARKVSSNSRDSFIYSSASLLCALGMILNIFTVS